MTYFADYAWLPGGIARDVRITVEAGRFGACHRRRGAASRATSGCPGVVLPGLRQHAQPRLPPGACAAGPTTAAARSGPGASRCTTSPPASTPTPIWRWPARPTPRWRWPGSPASASSTTCTTRPAAARTTIPTRWDGRWCRPRPRPASGSRCSTPAISPAGLRGEPLSGPQLRFGDGSAPAWAERVAAFGDPGSRARIGSAIHSVRAVPRDQLAMVAERRRRPAAARPPVRTAGRERRSARPRSGLRRPGCWPTPARCRPARRRCMRPTCSAADIALLAASRHRDQHVPLDRARSGRRHRPGARPGRRRIADRARLRSARDHRPARRGRGRWRWTSGWPPASAAGSAQPSWSPRSPSAGHAALGWTDAGRIEPGARADLVAVRLDTPRTAGVDPGQVVFAAGRADIDTVLVDGRVVVRGAGTSSAMSARC